MALNGGVQRDAEKMLMEINRENLDLKMQVYELTQKLSNSSRMRSSSQSLSPSTPLTAVNAEAVEELKQLKQTNSELSQRIMQLEKQLQASETKLSSTNTANAALLIAENDTRLIAKMQEENSKLKLELRRQVELNNGYVEKIGGLMQQIDELNVRLSQGRGVSLRLQQKVSLLVDRLRQYELVSKRHSRSANDLNSISNLEDAILALPPPPHPSSSSSSSSVGGGGDHHSTTLTKHMSLQQMDVSAAASANQRHSSKGHQHAVAPHNFLDFGSRTAWGELHSLRRQIADLKQQLRSERELFKAQEDALRTLQASIADSDRLNASIMSSPSHVQHQHPSTTTVEGENVADEAENWRQRYFQLEKYCLEAGVNVLQSLSSAGNGGSDMLSREGDDFDRLVDSDQHQLRTSAALVRPSTILLAEHKQIVDGYKYVHVQLAVISALLLNVFSIIFQVA